MLMYVGDVRFIESEFGGVDIKVPSREEDGFYDVFAGLYSGGIPLGEQLVKEMVNMGHIGMVGYILHDLVFGIG